MNRFILGRLRPARTIAAAMTVLVIGALAEIDTLTGWLGVWGRPSMPAMGHQGMAMPGMMSEKKWPSWPTPGVWTLIACSPA